MAVLAARLGSPGRAGEVARADAGDCTATGKTMLAWERLAAAAVAAAQAVKAAAAVVAHPRRWHALAARRSTSAPRRCRAAVEGAEVRRVGHPVRWA